MAEWSIAAVLKTVVPRGTGGSNPSSSAKTLINYRGFLIFTLRASTYGMFCLHPLFPIS